MPAWSEEVALAFLMLAAEARVAVDQSRLQRLVYIAHGEWLAATGQPLTGDRPEAWDYGPVYRRLGDLLGAAGNEPLGEEFVSSPSILSELEQGERDCISSVFQRYATSPMIALSSITRGEGSPWQYIYAEGKGRFRDIPHRLIREQFLRFVGRSSAI